MKVTQDKHYQSRELDDVNVFFDGETCMPIKRNGITLKDLFSKLHDAFLISSRREDIHLVTYSLS